MWNLLTSLCSRQSWHRWLADDPFGAVVAMTSLLCWLVAIRLALMLVLVLVARVQRALPGGQHHARRTLALARQVGPRFSRGLLVASLGVPMWSGSATAATDVPSLDRPTSDVVVVAPRHSTPSHPAAPPPPSRSRPNAAPPVIAVPAQTAPAIAAPIHSPSPTSHVVRPGECLWSIAAAELGPSATNADIARRWPQWWHSNEVVIGATPGLIQPGWVLSQPASPATLGGAR